MAMQHPVAFILRNEFDIARLRYADNHRIARIPARFRNAPAFRAGDVKLMAVQMNRVMIHAEIDDANAHALALFHN